MFSDVAVTTQALVSDVRAYVENGQPWVEWETASEVGTTAFNIFRFDPAKGEFVPLNETLLPALIGSPQGGVYRYPDANVVPGGTSTYLLEEVEARGISRKYGPYTVTAGAAIARPARGVRSRCFLPTPRRPRVPTGTCGGRMRRTAARSRM